MKGGFKKIGFILISWLPGWPAVAAGAPNPCVEISQAYSIIDFTKWISKQLPSTIRAHDSFASGDVRNPVELLKAA